MVVSENNVTTAGGGEEHIRRLLASVTDYVFTVEVHNGRAVRTVHSPGALAVTGFSPDEYQADPSLWWHMVHPQDRKAVIAHARQVRAGENPPALEHRLIHKDGSVRWVCNTSVARLDEQGRVIAYDGLITDITSRKQAEQALRESEEKYRALFEAAADAIFIETLDGLILDCNAAACHMFGWSKDEMLKLNVSDLMPPEIAPKIPELQRKILRHGEAFAEVVNRTRDGRLFPCEVRLRLIRVGEENRLIAYVHDLSGLKQAEEAQVQQLAAEARAQIAEATSQELARQVQERRRAEDELRESEERFRSTFEQAAVGIAHVSPEGEFLRINRRFCDIVGYAPEEMLVRTFQDITHPDDLQANVDYVRQVLAGKIKTYSMEKRYIRKSGEAVWVNLTVALLRDAKEQPKYFISAIEDITERKRVEEALRLNDARLEALQRLGELQPASDDELIQYALEEVVQLTHSQVGYLHFVNPGENSLQLFTWSKAVMENCQAEKVGHYPLEQAGVWVDCIRLRRPVIHNDYQNLPDKKGYPEGHFHIVRHMSVPLMDGDQVAAVVGVGNKLERYDDADARQLTLFMQGMWSILRRRQAERALQAALARLRELELIVNRSDAVAFEWRVEQGWPLVFVSDNVAQYGYSIEDFASGKLGIPDIVHPEDMQGLLETFKRCLAGSCGEMMQEFRILSPSGGQHWVQGRAWLRRDENGQFTYLQGLTIDISERKRMEEYMLRTERLAAMGYMSAVLAHEIKNPLQAIRSNLELVLDFDLEAAEREEYLRFCCQEIDNLTEITGRVLGYTRPGQETRPVPASVAALVDQALALSGDALRRAKVQVVQRLPLDLPPVMVYPGQVTQALLNLALNAAEAMPNGGRLEISAIVEPRHLALALANDGPPIPDEHLKDLFEPFFTTKPNSTGLGLFVSHGLLQQQGGSLSAENLLEGRGVVFTLRLPLAPLSVQGAAHD